MRSRVIFLLAITMGIITTFLFVNYINQREIQTVAQEPLIKVVVAKETIAENQLITAEILEVIEVVDKNIHYQAVTDVSEVEGKFVTAVIEKGEILLSHRLKTKQEENLLVARKVKEGFRAVSVGVNFVQSVSNLIEPDDQVDVVLSESIEKDGKTTFLTRQILTDVHVLAVGKKMVTATNEVVEVIEYNSVTLELQPNDAVTLINASERGNIQFTLHSRIIPSSEN